MAVQQGKMTRSRRGMRRSHDSLTTAALSVDKETGEVHRRHHITASGYYRGKQVINMNKVQNMDTDAETEE